jgi:muramoyltetrapeptide carboxypeptidase LdcA involved in peptidoglycan recycling
MKDTRSSIPPALQSGDIIAFVSPSSRLNRLFANRVEKATQYFKQQGFHVKEIYTDPLPAHHLDSIKQRCRELHTAFSDHTVKAIICTIGGLSANLPHLDYDLIRQNPKIFCGYSDITMLHHALITQAGLRTFYGPAVIPEFGESPEPLDFTSSHFFQTLMRLKDTHSLQQSVPVSLLYTNEFADWLSQESLPRPRKLAHSPGWKWLRPGRAEGRLYGGCLPSLVQLCGTKYPKVISQARPFR